MAKYKPNTNKLVRRANNFASRAFNSPRIALGDETALYVKRKARSHTTEPQPSVPVKHAKIVLSNHNSTRGRYDSLNAA